MTCKIQATMPLAFIKPSKVPMWKGAIGAYFIVATCYFHVALFGIWS